MKKTILMLISVFCLNLFASINIENKNGSTSSIIIENGIKNNINISNLGDNSKIMISPEKTMYQDFMYLLYILIGVSIFVFILIKTLLKNNMDIVEFAEKLNKLPEENKYHDFYILKKEILFILNKNIKSSLALNRINDLINTMEKRYEENIVLLKNINLNKNEIDNATEENKVILNNLKNILLNTKVNKKQIDFNEISKDIEKYINIINKTKTQQSLV